MSPQFWQDSLKFFSSSRHVLTLPGMVLGVTTIGSSNYAASPLDSKPAPSHYAQGDFTLPFQVKPGGRCPQQLDLMVSRDGGRNWQVQQSAAPAEGRFQLQNVDEGSYWLKVQVRDSVGTAVSPTTMLLAVDKTRPKANMQCDWQGESTLTVQCLLEDLYLDPDSVRLTLRTDVNTDPTAVPLELSEDSSAQCIAQAMIDIPPCKSFELRLCAADKAGNKMTTSERYFHPTLATDADALLPPTQDTPLVLSPKESALEHNVAPMQWTTIELGTPKSQPKTSLVSLDSQRRVLTKTPDRTNVVVQELNPPTKAALGSLTASSDSPQELMLESPVPADGTVVKRSQQDSQETLSPPAPPRSEPVRVPSSSRRIQINYALAQPMPSDQLNVEIWVTTNRGASWEFWGLDRDARSPAWIEVDRNGEFGFCVVCVHSDSDLQYRPRPGDNPDLMVDVNQPPAKRRLQPAARQ